MAWRRAALFAGFIVVLAGVGATAVLFLPADDDDPEGVITTAPVTLSDTTLPPSTDTIADTGATTSSTQAGIACRGDLVVDVDGDGVVDQASLQQGLVHVCLASGPVLTAEAPGMGELFAAHDFGGDGVVELLAGGTTIRAALYDVFAYVPEPQGLVAVTQEDGTPLTLIDGFYEGRGYLFGCVADDPQLVQELEVVFGEDAAGWTRFTYRVSGVTAVLEGEDAGTAEVAPPAGQEADALNDPRLSDLVTSCDLGLS